MILKELVLEDFKSFKGKHTFSFEMCNLIQGGNGAGKSTLCQNALLFLLYGYYNQPLAKLPSRDKENPKCGVIGTVLYERDEYKIKRTFPTDLIIWKNGKQLKLARANRQPTLNKLFKNKDYFKMFRMLDDVEGINLLELGPTTLKKTLLSFDQQLFNTVRQHLLVAKSDREKYNKSHVVHQYAPSQTRLDVLKKGLEDLDKEIRESESLVDLEQFQSLTKSQGISSYEISAANKDIRNVEQISVCPTCKQNIDPEHKNRIVSKGNKIIAAAKKKLEFLEKRLAEIKTERDNVQKFTQSLRNHRNKISTLITRLETRLTQKDYQYTDADVLIMKKALDELDKFYSFYLSESIRVLEPIINDVISRIGYTLMFELDDKGKFELILLKDGQEYSYKDLSKGQRLILDIAFQIALLMDKQDEGLIIADEGFSSLDDQNLPNIIEMFKGLPFQLICVVHRVPQIPFGVNVIDLDKPANTKSVKKGEPINATR